MASPPQPCLVNAIPFANDEQTLRYVRFNFRKIKGARCVDWGFCERIGLTDKFRELLGKSGLVFLSYLKEDTYKHLTMEFLSSLKLERDVSGSSLSFRLKGTSYCITSEQFGSYFELSCIGCTSSGRYFPVQEIWKELTGIDEEYLSKGAQASKIRDPSMRMLHEFLTYSLNARVRHNHYVQVDDLFLLKCIKDGKPINAAWWLMNRFEKISKSETGAVNIGGYVTHLAKCLKVKLNDDDEVYRMRFSETHDFVGEWALEECKMLVKFGGRWGRIQEEQDASLVATTSQEGRDSITRKRACTESSQDAPGAESSMTQTLLQQLCENVLQLSASVQQLNHSIQQLNHKVQQSDENVQNLSTRVKSLEEKTDLMLFSNISGPSFQPPMSSLTPTFPFNFSR